MTEVHGNCGAHTTKHKQTTHGYDHTSLAECSDRWTTTIVWVDHDSAATQPTLVPGGQGPSSGVDHGSVATSAHPGSRGTWSILACVNHSSVVTTAHPDSRGARGSVAHVACDSVATWPALVPGGHGS